MMFSFGLLSSNINVFIITLNPGLKPEPSPAQPELWTRVQLQDLVSPSPPKPSQARAFELSQGPAKAANH
jgi:hypothetical protein